MRLDDEFGEPIPDDWNRLGTLERTAMLELEQCPTPNKGEYCRNGFLYIGEEQTALCLCNCHWADAVTGEPYGEHTKALTDKAEPG